jgi:uncharacterized protein YggE
MRKKIIKNFFIVFLSFLLMGSMLLGEALIAPGPARASGEQNSTITVNGFGKVFVKPDQVRIQLGLLTMAPTAKEAQQENTVLLNKVIAALNQCGVSNEEIETTEYSIWPEYYQPKPEEQKPPSIISYRVNNIIRVTLNDLSMTGKVIDAAVNAGANRVQSIEFTKKDTCDAQLKALQLACQDAKAKAKAIAQTMGVELAGIISIQESGLGYTPVYLSGAREGASVGETPIQPSELQIYANVTVVYQIR